ncbi:hypothetical protein [Sulfobacillus sp. hq2]|uniref:hypothetical protein n=1 Tax=Sulfobacillus sp. hq2 TaxID=2039167 RepID=UPI000CD1B456|nr:hypothetical protein [Sulfobacillus sp. hq2]POB12184.1 hypothetical protein CO251_00730 [Sulfobacillus sp. hq2]
MTLQAHDNGTPPQKEPKSLRLSYRELLFVKHSLEHDFWWFEELDDAADAMPDEQAVRERQRLAQLRTVHTTLWRKIQTALDRRAARLTPDQRRRADLFRIE